MLAETLVAWSAMPALSSTSKQALIQIARQALEHFVKTGEVRSSKPEDPALCQPGACFVTLRKKGELRGCVGMLARERSLYEEVVRMTKAACSEDFRFSPLRPEELGGVSIEISVVSSLKKVHSWNEIQVGRHGIYLRWRERSGAFLPEVAEQMKWSAEEFVKNCCREKARIPESAWPEIELYRFTTEKIKETA